MFLLLIAVILAGLSVLLINGGPLYYYDTGSYIRQGNVALNTIFPDIQEAGGAVASYNTDDDGTASGSRSVIYGLIMAAFFRVNALYAIPSVHLAATVLAAWLLARTAGRYLENNRHTAVLTTVPLLVAAGASLPFYIAYMMPDIFAPILLIAIAALTAFGQKMALWELLLISCIALFSTVLHPSHMAVQGLMIPLVFLAALTQKAPGRWRALAFLVAVCALSVAERKAFQIAVETTTQKEVVYAPHITARLIVDGPGMDYLNEVCPDESVPTCALHEALSWSDDPYRLTASHIIFELSPNLGSFRLMSFDDQKHVALSQRDFAMAVFLSRPVTTSFALAENAFQQLLNYSIGMTIPTEDMLENARRLARLDESRFDLIQGGPLAQDHGWITYVDTFHEVIYALSFAFILIILLWPGSVAREVKLFALFVLLGIAVNALVCGGLAQPADRYGARVMWLLPFTATFLFLARWPSTPQSGIREAS